MKLDSSDSAYVKIWNLAMHDQDAKALAALDLLLVHLYAGTSYAPFAERYPESAVKVTGLGCEGGGRHQHALRGHLRRQARHGHRQQGRRRAVTFTSDKA